MLPLVSSYLRRAVSLTLSQSLSPRAGLPLPLSPRAGLPLPLSPRAAMSVSIQLQPSPRCLFDEPLEVRVSGLSPLQQVTLKAWLRDDKEQLFHSAAFYTADPRGQLDLAHSPSLGGHYTGVQPMGLFWSLSPVTPFTRLVKRDVATSPLSVHIEIFEGHWSLGQLPAQPLATAINQRWFMKEGLLRIPVREGRIRGTLFIPPGTFGTCFLPLLRIEGNDKPRLTKPAEESAQDEAAAADNKPKNLTSGRVYLSVLTGNGPFPGVISVNEIKGGLLEYRSSLLANHGFTTLVLAYHNYDDLPKGMINLDLGYFEEAVHFLKQHPKVKGPGVGAIGISKGADLVLSMAAFLPDVRAAVVINGCITSAEFGLCFKNKLISTGLRHTVSRMKIADSGVADVSEVINEVDKDSIIPIENTKGTILFIAGEEDKNWNSKHYVDEAVKRLKEHGNDGFEVLRYRGSGHYLEPPFFPFCYASYHSVLNICTKWGGNAKDHSSAQVESWQKIQAFFRKILHQ